MLTRIGRVEIDERPDGHCGYWSVGRFLHFLFGVRFTASSGLVRWTRAYVARAIEAHIDELVLVTLWPNHANFKWNTRRRRLAAEAEENFVLAARAIRNVPADRVTMNREHWFGGRSRLHFFAVARASAVPVHCLHQHYPKVITVRPNCAHEETPMDRFTPDDDRDFFLYFVNGNHYKSFVPRAAGAS